MGALEVEALAVEPEGAVLEHELAEAAPGRVLVRGAVGQPKPRGDAVEVGVLDVPQPRVGHPKAPPDRGQAWGQAHRLVQRGHRLTARPGGARQVKPHFGGCGRAVPYLHLGVDGARAHIGAEEQVLDPYGRHLEELDRVRDAALGEGGAGAIGDHPVASRGLAKHVAVDRLVGRVEHTHRELVRAVSSHQGRDIEHEGRLAALVAAHVGAVQPHIGQVVDRPEAEESAATRVRASRGLELAPVPGDPVVGGEGILDDPRDLRRPHVSRRALPPLGLPPLVLGVDAELPRAIERHGERVEPLGERAVHGPDSGAGRRGAGDGTTEHGGEE